MTGACSVNTLNSMDDEILELNGVSMFLGTTYYFKATLPPPPFLLLTSLVFLADRP
jgi:hypothetical protein